MALAKPRWTEAQYLAFERASEEKHEFIDGEVVAMSGASENHNLIVASTIGNLLTQVRKKMCKIFPSDMRVRVVPRKLYAYPDISIVCGNILLANDENRDTLLNPTVIVEVLSPSTEAYDRGKKFIHYRTLESLQEYILIAQDHVHIERFVRQPTNEWLLSEIYHIDSNLELAAIGCQLSAASVYEQVTFEDNPADENTNTKE
jgi:Uma2 family endonuclease